MRAAVLTGDIIGSTRADKADLERCFAVLAEATEAMAPWHGAPLRLTRFRGDGWQVCLARRERALRSALYIQAALRAADLPLRSRIGMGLGTAELPPGGDLSGADGSAFRAAGRALDAIGRGRQMSLAGADAPALAPALAVLCDALQQGWSREQGEALTFSLQPDPPTQAEIAGRLGIRQQSVANRLQAARFWALSEALDAFESACGGDEDA